MACTMTFLVVNCGTSSIKITIFDEGLKRIKEEHLNVSSDYPSAIMKMEFPTSLKGIGHRVVHGGERYIDATLITPAIEKDLQELSKLAPLHNPPALSGIDTMQKLFPHVPQIAVFDTAFHAHLPPKAAYYPIPWELSQKHKIKRYGFHGIAHAFSWKTYSRANDKQRVITLHLGSGCSMTAIRSGVSLDTTMGFTPLDGLMMATRSGEIDPAVVAYLCEKEGKTPDEIISLLNHRSGLHGVSEASADMEKILALDTPQAKLAVEMFVYHIQKKIGAFLAVLEGVDVLIFSGGIGENSWDIRQKIAQSLSWYDVALDEKKNRACVHPSPGEIQCISKAGSKIALYVVGSDENQLIVEEVQLLLSK